MCNSTNLNFKHKGLFSLLRGQTETSATWEKIEEDDKEFAAYLSERWENDTVEKFYRCYQKSFPILYAMERHPKAIPAMSAPAESSFLGFGKVVTKSRINLSPTTTKMLAVVKNKVMKLRLCDVDMGIEFGGTNIDDDLEVRVGITGDNDDNSYEIFMDKEYADSNYFGE